MSLSASVLLGCVGAVTMYVGAHQIAGGHADGWRIVFRYTLLLGFLIAPIMQIVSIGTQLTEALAGLERTQEIMRERPEDQDPKRTVALARHRRTSRVRRCKFQLRRQFTMFCAIFLFAAEPGTVTALVGSSGSGKSTTIGLISAFYVPTKGAILVDGMDLSTVRLDSYRTRLGVVLQESFLFDGTIRENVAFSRPDASEEEIMRACRIARVDEFAESFAEKYDTIVGERGVKLSGGQRQRISIARAILAEPRILILDEATSSLDSESEQMIQHGLSYLMQGRTTFVIAHRLSTIRRADQIHGDGAGTNRGARHARATLCRARPLLRSLYQAARRGREFVSRSGRGRRGEAMETATRQPGAERRCESCRRSARAARRGPLAHEQHDSAADCRNTAIAAPAIRTEHLCRHYRMGETLIRAVDGVSLEIARRRVCRAARQFRLGKIFGAESDCRPGSSHLGKRHRCRNAIWRNFRAKIWPNTGCTPWAWFFNRSI